MLILLKTMRDWVREVTEYQDQFAAANEFSWKQAPVGV
jgi:hypothetical protein